MGLGREVFPHPHLMPPPAPSSSLLLHLVAPPFLPAAQNNMQGLAIWGGLWGTPPLPRPPSNG